MSGIRKLILIIILIIFQTSALTIGGMTARALLKGNSAGPLGAIPSDVKQIENAGSTNIADKEDIQKDTTPQQSSESSGNELQRDKSTIEVEAVTEKDLIEVHKVIKKDDVKLESETTRIIPIPEEKSQSWTGAK